MSFIPRDPVIQNQFCTHDSTQSTTMNAGDVVYLTGSQTVSTVSGSGNQPYGLVMQRVKAEITGLPTGYRTAADLGSSDAFTGDPVAVAHLGIYDTTTYVLDNAKTTFTAGEFLYADVATAHLVNGTNGSAGGGVAGAGSPAIAVAQNSLSAADVVAEALLRVKLLI
jgi:hypothetical protein